MKDELVYPKETTLGTIAAILALMVWVVISLFVLFYGLFIFLFYLFAQSALVAWLRGNGVRLSATQMPDLHAQFEACCTRLGLDADQKPEAYLLQGDGAFNAFAARFLGRHYLILLSDVVDAMAAHPDGVSFYIGHELGHIRMCHFTGHLLRWPVLWLPLLGAAYSRAREYTCDRHGRACCSSPEHAARALVALAAGAERWKFVDLPAFAGQAAMTNGFWMSYHELTGGYPWLTKRTARVLDPDAPMPRRHAFAGFLACFVPYAGRLGGAGGIIVVAFVIGMLAAIGVPAYHDYKTRAELTTAYLASEPARLALAEKVAEAAAENRDPPESLAEAGVDPLLADGTSLSYDGESRTLSVESASGRSLDFTLEETGEGKFEWRCSPGHDVSDKQAPAGCRATAAAPSLPPFKID